jgi:nucleoside-diphosphate-sugar epimerase
VRDVIPEDADELYQLAADMGGMTYIGNKLNDASIMTNSVLINLNVLQVAVERKVKKIFYSSSACIYPEYNQLDPENPKCSEDSAYPAAPDSEYGWEKLYSERLYKAYELQYGLNVRIARFHNIYGPLGTYTGGKEKAPAALSRKVALASDYIEVIGDGNQTRSLCHIDDLVYGLYLLASNPHFSGPINLGNPRSISIIELAKLIVKMTNSQSKISLYDLPQDDPQMREPNIDKAKEILKWEPRVSLEQGLLNTIEYFVEIISK